MALRMHGVRKPFLPALKVPEQGTVLYLHGFRSSSQSLKARQLVTAMTTTNWSIQVPDLPLAPDQAIAKIEGIVSQRQQAMAIVGSSLGGYYASYLACKYQLPACLINPAVQAYTLLEEYLGPVQNLYNDETTVLTRQHIQYLRDLDVDLAQFAPRLQVFLKTDDEVLDTTLAAHTYRAYECWIDAKGDHSFADFDKIIPAIFRFCGINTRTIT